MRLFIGHAEAAVDGKGRLAMPLRYRRLLLPEDHDTFVVGLGLDGQLWAFPHLVWAELCGRIRDVHPANPYSEDQSSFHRRFTQESDECRLDPQGRILLPSKHRAKAKIGTRATVAGSLDWLEIWEPGAYADSRAKSDKAAEASARRIVLPPRLQPAEE